MNPLIPAALVVLFEGLSFGAVLPVLTGYSAELGGGPAIAGLLFAMLTAPKVILNPLWGKLSDKQGRKPTLMILGLGTLSGSLLWAFAPTLGHFIFGALVWLVISRAVAGIFAAQAALTFAVAADVTRPEKRAVAMGMLGAAFGTAFVFGPALGGITAKHFSSSSVGFLCAGFQTLSFLTITVFLRETLQKDHHVTRTRLSLRQIAVHRYVPVLLLATLLTTIGYAVLIPTFQPLTKERFNFDFAQTGYALSVLGMVGIVVQGGLIRPTLKLLGERATAVFGTICLAGGLFLVGFDMGLPGMWVGIIGIGLGTGFMMPAILGLLSMQVSDVEQGSVHGLNQSVTSMGRAIGFALSGVVFAAAGATVTYTAGAIIAAAAVLPILIVAAHHHSDDKNESLPVTIVDPD